MCQSQRLVPPLTSLRPSSGTAVKAGAPNGWANALTVAFGTVCLVARDAWRRRPAAAVHTPPSSPFPPPPPPPSSAFPAPPPARRGDGLGALRAALRAPAPATPRGSPGPFLDGRAGGGASGASGSSAAGGGDDAAGGAVEHEEAHARSSLLTFLRAAPPFASLCGVSVTTMSAATCATTSTEWGDGAAWFAPHPPAAGAATGWAEDAQGAEEEEEEAVCVTFAGPLDPRRSHQRVVALSARLLHGASSSHVGTVSLVFRCADAPPPGSYEALLLGAARCVGEHITACRASRAAADAAAQLAVALAVVCDIYPAGVAARLTGRASVGRLSLGRVSAAGTARASTACSRLSASSFGGFGDLGGGCEETPRRPVAARSSSPVGRRYSMSALKAGALAAATVRRTSAGAAGAAAVDGAGEAAAAAAVVSAASPPLGAAPPPPPFAARPARVLRRSASLDGCPDAAWPGGRSSPMLRPTQAAASPAGGTTSAPRRGSFDTSQLRTRSRPRSPAPHSPAPPQPGFIGGGDEASFRWIGSHPAYAAAGGARGSVSASARLSGSSESSALQGRLAGEAARREGFFQGRTRRTSASETCGSDRAAAAGANAARGNIFDPKSSWDGLIACEPLEARAPDARAAAALPFRASLGEDELFVEHHDDVSIVFADVVGFTRLCEESTPVAVMTMLHALFSHLDELCELCGLYKVETSAPLPSLILYPASHFSLSF